MILNRELIHSLPKVDLHCHLDGSIRYESILDIAEQQKINLGYEHEDALKKALVMGDLCEDLNDYLKSFAITLKVLQTKENLARAAFELGEDASKENLKYLEVRFSPILHQELGLTLTHVIDSVLNGLEQAKSQFGLEYGVIICGMRHIDPKSSLTLAELCVAYKNRGVVGFDLAGAEANNPPKDHIEAYYRILNNNINCTLHAGEAWGPDSIHQAIHYCGAHRIGHGTRLKEDGDLLNYINDHRIPLEVCPKSNIQTRAVDKIEDHPLKFYLDLGLRVTVNTDNRLITNTTVTDELLLCVDKLEFNKLDLYMVLINGVKSAFLSFTKRREMVYNFKAEIKEKLNLK